MVHCARNALEAVPCAWLWLRASEVGVEGAESAPPEALGSSDLRRRAPCAAERPQHAEDLVVVPREQPRDGLAQDDREARLGEELVRDVVEERGDVGRRVALGARVERRRLEDIRWDDRMDCHLCEPPDRETCLGLILRGHLAQQVRVGGGDVLEGEADDSLGAERLVERLRLGEHRAIDRREHRAVAVEQAAVVERVALLLRGEAAGASLEGGEVAAVGVAGDGLLLRLLLGLHPRAPNLGEPVARRKLALRVLGEGDADRVAEAVGEERADADRALHAAVLALARLGHAEVERVVPAEPVHLGREQPVALRACMQSLACNQFMISAASSR